MPRPSHAGPKPGKLPVDRMPIDRLAEVLPPGSALVEIVDPPVQFETIILHYEQGVDLETGTMTEPFDGMASFQPYDFVLGYAAGREVPGTLFQTLPGEIAFLDEIPLESVTPEMIEGAALTQSFLDIPLESDDSVILRTADGNIFVIGNAVDLSTSTELLASVDFYQFGGG